MRKNLKSSTKFFGLYEVIRKLGPVAYILKLPATSKIHPVFHVSQLKKKIGEKVVSVKDRPFCSDDGQILAEPIVILDKKVIKRGNNAITQVLVQWANLSKEEATWEDYSFLKSQFPKL